jgi:ATP-dependent helicase/nuclease subunit A
MSAGGDIDPLVPQRRAADPAVSAWVMANAGSGKTRVLTDRVIRLLLAETRPGAILCLTFTKAAAAEMANRLHQRLGAWSVMPEAELRDELVKLQGRQPSRGEGGEPPPPVRGPPAWLDAEGRLRIQTIHAFCESLLKRFPLEAGVPPHFAIADDATAKQLIEDARERLLAGAQADGVLSKALEFVVGEVEEIGFQAVLDELVAERRRLRRLLGAHNDDIEAVIAAMRELLDVAADDTPETLRAAFVDGLPEANLRRAAAALDSGSESDQRRAGCIRAFLEAGDRADRVSSEWLEIFMTAEGKPRNTLITKKAQKEDPGALSILQEEQRRVGEFCERLKAVTVANGTAALLRLGSALLDHYENGKRSRALLDYDDLILHSGALLSR